MKPLATYQKLRGGYYTPEPIAQFLAAWAIQAPDAMVLEPSCGDGIMLEAAANRLADQGATHPQIARQLQGVELDNDEAHKARERLKQLEIPVTETTVFNGDFFAFCQTRLARTEKYDAIIGNPPFIRYQTFPEPHRLAAFGLMARVGLKPNRLTNAWVPFLVGATLLLKDTGRLAMVIPAELLQVNYAAQLRRFLGEHYGDITLITFKKLLFESVQQEVVLLLCERNDTTCSHIRTAELQHTSDLATYCATSGTNNGYKTLLPSTEKWTQYFLNENEIHLLRELRDHPGLTLSGHVIDVDVGIVTGLNAFFVLTEDQVHNFALEAYTQRIVGRSAHLPGIIFADQDWMHNATQQRPAFLLAIPDVPSDTLPESVRAYIVSGEGQQFHTGYKCRMRNRWYVVPSVWTPQAFMLRQIHQYPRLVLNHANATCTDTIHRVKLRNGTQLPYVVAAFINSLTFAFTEVIGRSYGGGVLELEPREAEQLPLPLIGAEQLDLDTINALLQHGDVAAALDLTDRVLLADGLGLSHYQIASLRTIWHKLRDRRINRR